MAHAFVGLHALFGELGILSFLWAFVELLGISEDRIRRAKIASLVGLIFLILSWVVGGFYYVTIYGPVVRPIIKSGPEPWAHEIGMETKEHVFLMIPFLAVLQNVLLRRIDLKDEKSRHAILGLTGWITLFSLSIALLGFLISTGYRDALEILAKGAVLFLPLGSMLMLIARYLFFGRRVDKLSKKFYGDA